MIEPIVSASWLTEALEKESSDVVLADVRWYLDGRDGYAAYLDGHLPGAVFIDLDTVLAGPGAPSIGRHPLPEPEVFARGLGRAGIGEDSMVVAYDDAAGMTASRLVWMLRILGRNAALLDGGLDAWTGPLERGAPETRAVAHKAEPWPDNFLAGAENVKQHLADGGLVVDARAAERYRGEFEPVDPRPGHIPGAVNLPFTDLLRDGSLRSDVRDILEERGIDSTTIAYCGSGVSACLEVLAAESVGLGRPRLYIGSWSGWSSEPSRPAALGDEQ
ncbi:MAG: sulfurtransferase [Acidimicrobiia bacterium]|nr:sulfurtransferase [Acidimicrobiia bacterium]